MSLAEPIVFQTSGYCPTCDNNVEFIAKREWFRDHLKCSNCGSIPRERALMVVINSYFPNWRDAVIHESSPVPRGASSRMATECAHYIPSQFFKDCKPGDFVGKMRCENLEALSFPDESVDLHVTQDVFEHVFHPSKAFRELARTLKPGGMHIGTVPLVRKHNPSKLRACIKNNELIYLEPQQYHGNPVGNGQALVTIDWGFDICEKIFLSSGLITHIVHIDDLSKGIRAEYIEVLVSIKPKNVDV